MQESDIVSVDPKPGDSTRSIIRVRNSGSRFGELFVDYTMVETYAAFKVRYTDATSTDRILEADSIEEDL